MLLNGATRKHFVMLWTRLIFGRPVAGSYEHSNKPSVSVNGFELIYLLSECYLLKTTPHHGVSETFAGIVSPSSQTHEEKNFISQCPFFIFTRCFSLFYYVFLFRLLMM